MEVVEKYRCDICSQVYDYKKDAIECEKSDILTDNIQQAPYREYGYYPVSVLITMKNGVTKRYARTF